MTRLARFYVCATALLLACALAPAFAAEAATRFVATTGSNAGPNTCLASGSPCKTITHALTQAVANDTISVAAGTYNLALGETFPLVIAVNLALTGAGAPGTIIDAGGTNRVIQIDAGIVTISGVTITGGNLAQGGGLSNGGTLTLTNSTVSGNTVSCTASGGTNSCGASGGGIFHDDEGAPPSLTATIVANQLAGGDCDTGGDTITSNGFNLDSDGSCGLSGAGDQSVVDPLLGPLQNNGGPTQTHALLTGSPAIDAVTSGCPPPATDQRGVTRPQGTACDIGAYELETEIAPIPAGIPTLSEWAQIGMVALLLGGGLLAIRRKRQRLVIG